MSASSKNKGFKMQFLFINNDDTVINQLININQDFFCHSVLRFLGKLFSTLFLKIFRS